MQRQRTIQLGELCTLLGVGERDARYVLERGFIPKGVENSPDSGNYRRFGPGQAFWLGMLLKLKQSQIPAPLAAKIADYAERSLKTVTQNLGWDWQFLPMRGAFDTEHVYHLEVAELKYVRFGTDANPSSGGRFEYFDWHDMDQPGKPLRDLRPCVVIRLDLSQVAHSLAGAFDEPDWGCKKADSRL